MTELGELLAQVGQLVDAQRRAFETGPVRADATLPELRAALGGPTPETPTDSSAVIRALAAEAAPGVVGIPGPRYFGFVIGGSHPAALAADWLTSGWDNNAGLYVAAPAASVMEEVAGRWVVDLLGLPATASTGFVTGGLMANFTGLAAARHRVLARRGLGRRDARSPGCAARASHRRRGASRDDRRRARLPRLRPRHRGARRRRRPGPHARRCAAGDVGRGGSRTDDRLRAGGQRELGRVRSARRDLRRPRTNTARGSTSTARSACGPR